MALFVYMHMFCLAGLFVVAVLAVGLGVCLFVLSYSLTILSYSAILEFQNYTHTPLKTTFNTIFFCNKQISSALGIRPTNSFR